MRKDSNEKLIYKNGISEFNILNISKGKIPGYTFNE